MNTAGKILLSVAAATLSVLQICGAQWTQTNGPYGGAVWAFAATDSFVLLGSYDGVFRSFDNGTNWQPTGLSKGWVTSFAAVKNMSGGWDIFAGARVYGAYRSSDNGANWTEVNSGLTSNDCYDFIIDTGGVATKEKHCSPSVNSFAITRFGDSTIGYAVFAAISKTGVFRSTDRGARWTEVFIPPASGDVFSLAADIDNKSGGEILAGTSDGVFLSTNNGTSWSSIGLTGSRICNLAMCKDESGVVNIFANDDAGNLYLSSDNRLHWSRISPKRRHYSCMVMSSTYPLAVYRDNDGEMRLFTRTEDGLFRSIDKGKSWTSIADGIPDSYMNAIACIPDEEGEITLLAGARGPGVFRSTNDGNDWSISNTGLTNTRIQTLFVIPSPDEDESSALLAGTKNSGIFLSNDYGESWTAINEGLIYPEAEYFAVCPDEDGNQDFFAATSSGLFVSKNLGSRWFTASKIHIFSSFVGVGHSKSHEPYLYAGAYMHAMLVSKDHGSSWDTINDGITDYQFRAFGEIPGEDGSSIIFVGTSEGAIYRSSDDGKHWANVAAETQIGGLCAFVTVNADSGKQYLFAAASSGVFFSTDRGASWTNAGLPQKYVIALTVCYDKSGNAFLFAGCANGNVYISKNLSLNWTVFKSGTDKNGVESLAICGSNLFVAYRNSCVLRYSLKDILQ